MSKPLDLYKGWFQIRNNADGVNEFEVLDLYIQMCGPLYTN